MRMRDREQRSDEDAHDHKFRRCIMGNSFAYTSLNYAFMLSGAACWSAAMSLSGK